MSKKLPQSAQPENATSSQGAVVLTGVRLTQGNAVDCPQIRSDDGQVHSVSRLSSGVAIGDRISVSGAYGVTTSCRGTVLVVENETAPGN